MKADKNLKLWLFSHVGFVETVEIEMGFGWIGVLLSKNWIPVEEHCLKNGYCEANNQLVDLNWTHLILLILHVVELK